MVPRLTPLFFGWTISLTNNEQENADKTKAYNVIKRSGICIDLKKNKILFFSFKAGAPLKDLKTCLFRPISVNACQQNSSPSYDPVP
jgi:hypothetical protein